MKTLKIVLITFTITISIIALIGVLTYEKKEFITERKPTAKAYISVKNYNFGTISTSDTINYSFIIKNVGSTPLKIFKIASSCNCTLFEYNKNPIMKDKELIIKTQFIPKKNKLGLNTASILIESNFDKNVTELKIEGIVNN